MLSDILRQIPHVVVNNHPWRVDEHSGLLWRADRNSHLRLLVISLFWGGCNGPYDRRCPRPEEFSQRFPELPPHQTVVDGVQAAVGVRQANGHGEDVRLHGVVRVAEVNHVEFDQDAPGCQRLVGQPAEEERQDHDCDRLGDFGASLCARCVDAFGGEEAQKEQVGGRNDDQRDYKAQQHFLRVVESQPKLRGPVGLREFDQAKLFLDGDRRGRGEHCRREGGGHGSKPNENGDAPSGAAARPPTTSLEGRGEGPVPDHAHGGQEKHAGVHVHSRHVRNYFAHGFPERPCEVQRVFHRPERQSQDELEVSYRQTSHEKVDGGLSPHFLWGHEAQD